MGSGICDICGAKTEDRWYLCCESCDRKVERYILGLRSIDDPEKRTTIAEEIVRRQHYMVKSEET